MMNDASDTTIDAQHFAADQCHALRNAVDRHYLAHIASIDRSESWKPDGAPSMEHWVSFRYGTSWEAAVVDVRVARALEGLPHIASAYADGSLSKEKVVDLCSFVTPDDDERWATEAPGYTASYVKRSARYAKRMRRQQAAELDEQRALHMQWDLKHDVLRINGVLPGPDGSTFKNAIERIAAEMAKPPDGTWPSLAERQADALVALAGGSSSEATVVIHVGARDLNNVHGNASLEGGPVVPSEVARRLGCDGYLQAVIHAEDGTPIGIGRRSRIVPRSLQHQVRERDQVCVCCGSSLTVGSEIHHVIPWSRGGRTDLDNLVLVCRRCHRLIHDRGYGLRRHGDGSVTLSNPAGRPIMNRPAKLRPDIRDRFLGPPNRVAMRC